MDSTEALAALDAKRQAETQLAKAAHCPAWRHASFGLIMGALVATPAFQLSIRLGVLACTLCIIAVIVQSDRRRLGMFINGYRRGKTRNVALSTLGGVLWLYMVSVYYGLERHNHTIPLGLGALALVFATIGSVRWQHVFVREMGS